MNDGSFRKVREITAPKKAGAFGTVLGSYNFKTKLIEILPKTQMYNLVLQHEMNHAQSKIARVMGYLWNWKIIAGLQVSIAIGWIYSLVFGIKWSDPQTTFAFGLISGLALMMLLSAVEELRNRLQDRKVRCQ